MITVPVEVLDAAGLDAEMRAIAEMAASGSEQRAALPPVEMDPAERAMEELPQIETSDIWIEELPDVPAPGGGNALTPDDVSTEEYRHEGESTPSEAEAAAEGKLQIKGWASGGPSANHTLAEILSGREVAGSVTPPFDRDARVVVRCADGSLAYVQISRIFTDGASAEFRADSTTGNLILQVKGFDAAQTGQVPVKRNGAIAWEAQAGGIEVGTPKTVVTGFEWVDSSHADFAQHPYTFKVSRGNLTISGGKLSVITDPSLATYIATTPLSQEAT